MHVLQGGCVNNECEEYGETCGSPSWGVLGTGNSARGFHLGLSTLELLDSTQGIAPAITKTIVSSRKGPICNIYIYMYIYKFNFYDPCCCKGAFFITHEREFEEFRGPNPTDKAHAADQ